jgi:hypothetical protein
MMWPGPARTARAATQRDNALWLGDVVSIQGDRPLSVTSMNLGSPSRSITRRGAWARSSCHVRSTDRLSKHRRAGSVVVRTIA